MRPLLVLVLVLGAIAALLFAVFSLDSGGNKPSRPELPANPVVSTTTGPSVPAPLEGTGTREGTRTIAPVKPTDHTPGGGPANSYDNKLTGLVKNVAGAPVAGAEVTITTLGSEEMFFINDPLPDLSKAPRVRTDNEGRYTFLGIEPRERYSLIVVHPQYARKTEQSMPIGESGPIEQPPIVLMPGATLSGYVRNEPGDLIPDATLHLESSDFANLITTVAPDRMTVKTNKEGYYTFQNVAPGQRTLTVVASGYGQVQIPGLLFQKEEQLTRDVTLKVGEMICGRVLGPGNEGVPKATVIAVGVSSTQQSARGQTETNDKGEFCFETLLPGEYNVIASAHGYRSGPRASNRVSTNTSNLVIEMFKEASVCGRVVDASTGQPIQNFTVRMRFWYGGGSPSAPSSPGGQDVTNAGGEFCIEGVPASDYVVEAFAPGYAPSFSSNFSVQPSKPVAGITVKLNRGGTITGRIVDADGKPVARARIVTHDNDWTDDAFTAALDFTYPTEATTVDVRSGDDGRFSCSNLTADSYQILVSAAGFTQYVKRDIRVNEGSSLQLGDIKLGRGGSVRGTLFDASGKPLAGGSITLRPADDNYVRTLTTKTGADGRFEIRNAAPGRYLLSGSRAAAANFDPFSEIAETKGSEVQIVIAENDATLSDLRLVN